RTGEIRCRWSMYRLRRVPRDRAGQFQTERCRRPFLCLQATGDARRRRTLQGSNGRLPGRSNGERRNVILLRRLIPPSLMGKQGSRRSQSVATVPVALSVAGSDSSAGAGIQADLKTFSALGIYGLTAVTCTVAEIPGKVSQIEPAS